MSLAQHIAGETVEKERYLKIPYHILNIPHLDLCEKVLPAHIYSFGEKGCWQSNETLGEIFMVSPSTVSRWLGRIKQFLYVKNPKGYYRTVWAKSHRDVREAVEVHFSRNAKDPAQNCSSDYSKSAIRLKQFCVTTNNNTKKEIIKETISPPSPLPAHRQASAALEERKERTKVLIEQLKAGFGLPHGRTRPALTEQEFEAARQRQRAALLQDQKTPIPLQPVKL